MREKWSSKRFDQRIDQDEFFIVTPEDDNELLVHIPFSCPVQLTSFFIISGEHEKNMKKVHLY